MAGIGWRLERLIEQGISGTAAAYATGAAVMALPWVLTTAVLVSLRAILLQGVPELASAGTVVSVAYGVALIVAGPVQIVVSRYAADRLYEGRLRAIAAPICRALGTTLLVCAVAATLALLALGLPPRTVLWGGALSATVGAQWTALSVGNGLCSPALVLGAVGAGSAVSFVFAAFLVTVAGLGVPGYLFGMMSGQALTLGILLVAVLRALPDETDDRARLLPAFRDYAALAGAGLAFNASLWADKLVAWSLVGGKTAALHSGASTIAWFSAIPCLAWVFVELETRFYRRFRAFFLALESGASLAELRRDARALEREAARLLRGAVSVQLGVTAFLQFAADPLAHRLGLSPEAVLVYRLLLVAAGAQAVGMLGLVLLYYFDLRREACLAAVGLLVGITAFTVAAAVSRMPPSVGTLLGCACGAIFTWRFVFRGVRAVLRHTLLAQPYGVARNGNRDESELASKPARVRPLPLPRRDGRAPAPPGLDAARTARGVQVESLT